MNNVTKRNYKCPSCNEVYSIDVATDERGLFPEFLCEKCDTLCPTYRDPEQPLGNIEDIENNNLQI